MRSPSAEQRAIGSVLGSWAKTMRDVVRNKERWGGAVRLPKILVLTYGLEGHVQGQEALDGLRPAASTNARC